MYGPNYKSKLMSGQFAETTSSTEFSFHFFWKSDWPPLCTSMFWALNSVPLVYVYILFLITYSLNNSSFTRVLKLGNMSLPTIFFFFPQNCFGYSSPLLFHKHLRISFSVAIKNIYILLRFWSGMHWISRSIFRELTP